MANTIQQAQSDKALIRRRQVEQLVQLSRSTIYAAVKAGTFAPPVRIGARAGRGASRLWKAGLRRGPWPVPRP